MLEVGIAAGNSLSAGSYPAILSCVEVRTGHAVVPHSVLDTVSMTGTIRRHPLLGRLSHISSKVVWPDDYCSFDVETLFDMQLQETQSGPIRSQGGHACGSSRTRPAASVLIPSPVRPCGIRRRAR